MSFETLISQAFGDGFHGDCASQPREYTTFLGMAVESFDANTKWSAGSTLDVTLYEDGCGDTGRPPAIFRGMGRSFIDPQTNEMLHSEPLYRMEDMVGAPYRFAMGDFEFCGLLQALRETHEESGKQAWKASLKSPDDLASQIHLVLSGYYNELGVGNVFNIGKTIEEQKSYYWRQRAELADRYQRVMSQALSIINANNPRAFDWIGAPVFMSALTPRVLSGPSRDMPYGTWTTTGNTTHWMTPHGPISTSGTITLQGSGAISIQAMANSIGSDTLIRLWCQLFILDHRLSTIRPTTYGSMQYQEILWAFNKLQSEADLDNDLRSGVRFNHNNVFPHPDLLIEDDAIGWRGQYYVDLTEMPGCRNSIIPIERLPQGFRIKQDHITLEDFVKQSLGEDGFRCDYIWELRPSALRHVGIQANKLRRILREKEATNAHPNISVEAVQAELNRLNGHYTAMTSGEHHETIRFKIPIIKLKVCPQGQSEHTNVRHIKRTVQELRARGIGVTGHSTGLEKAEDMPSILLNGGKKEIMVTAGNNLFYHDPIFTGNPFDARQRPGTFDGRVHSPGVTQNWDNPLGVPWGWRLTNEYPSVWRMYFGQDRYNNPQVMFGERVRIPFNFYIKPGENLQARTQWTNYHLNYVFLDTYEVAAGLRFFANNVNAQFLSPSDVPDNRPIIPGPNDVESAFRLPDYIKISENEIRASIDFDLFWWTVCMSGGDLYRLFVMVLDDVTARSVYFHAPSHPLNAATMTNPQSAVTNARIRRSMSSFFNDSRLSNAGKLNTPRAVYQMIIDDVKRIQEWVKKKSDEYYAKSYVTPFYFHEVTLMLDENQQEIPSYEPQPTGFREYGGTDFMGLVAQDPSMTGMRGLEAFTDTTGKTESFVRFHDPVRPVVLDPPLDGNGNVIPNGWGNGINPMVVPPRPTDRKMVYAINTINTDQLDPDKMVRTMDFLYYKSHSVKHIKNGNLVHIMLDQPVFEYMDGPDAENMFGGGMDPGTYAGYIQNTLVHLQRNQVSAEPNPNLATPAQFLNWIGMPFEPNDTNGNSIPAFRHIQNWAKGNTSIGAAYGISSITPKAKFPVDGCYGVRCHYINYGPWTIRNGDNPGRYQQDDQLTPWRFGTQLEDPEVAHARMNTTALLSISSQIATHRYSHVAEQGVITVAGYPSLRIGSEIGHLVSNRPSPSYSRYRVTPFGLIYGAGNFGEDFFAFAIDEPQYTGAHGPNVTRITVNVQVEGSVTTSYDLNKYTAKDGFLAKHFIDRIEQATGFTRSRTMEFMEEIKRMFENQKAAYAAFTKRNMEDWAHGKRQLHRTPHNVLEAQNAKLTHWYVDGASGRVVGDVTVTSRADTGTSVNDTALLTRSNDEYLNKAFMSMDGFVAPYATTGTEEGILLETMYRRRIMEESQGRRLTPEEIDIIARAIRERVEVMGDMHIPHARKPSPNNKSTLSVSDGPRFLTLDAIRRFNNEGVSDQSQMVPGHPINNRFLNPLINPAEVDNNELMTSAVGLRSRSSLGHSTTVVAGGLVPQDSTHQPSNMADGNHPYSVHYRGIGLSGPVWITGWGYNTENLPVPRDANSLNYFTKNFASRKDLHATGPLDIRFDEDRGVWTIPTPRMYFVVMMEDMKTVDVSVKNREDRVDFDTGYRWGEEAGRQDRATQNNNIAMGLNNPLNARAAFAIQLSTSTDTTVGGFNMGYEHGLHDIPAPVFVPKPNHRVYGIAKILNPKNGIEGYINLDNLGGTRLLQGDRCFAWQDAAEDKYYAMPTGITLDTGLVVRDIEPAGDLDPRTNELMGGGWVMLDDGSTVRAYCGMVQELAQAIPPGARVEFLSIGGRNQIINRLC
jgi:hypothetical protein